MSWLGLSQSELAQTLRDKFKYSEAGSDLTAEKIIGLSEGLRSPFLKYWTTGELPSIETHGWSIHRLVKERGIHPPSAFVTIDEINMEPDRMLKILTSKYDTVSDMKDNKQTEKEI